MKKIIAALRSLTPPFALSGYHYALALLGAARFGFPGRSLTVIAVTGTKGKSSTTEMVAAMLEASGKKTALASTIRFSIAGVSEPNLFKMTTPGRFFLQRFLRKALDAGCTHVVLELTSEGARQHRHRFLSLDALIVTNLQKEHIESHGSFEKYAEAKLSIARALARSPKRERALIINAGMPYAERFIALGVPATYRFSLDDARPYELHDDGTVFTWKGTRISTPLMGAFNIENALAALTLAQHLNIAPRAAADALGALPQIKGRVEHVDAGQDFSAVVDYAHTPDSLKALYGAFDGRKRICVLGNTGGGRDAWKRPEMGAIADSACEIVILTDEDPYDEDPRAIVEAMAKGMTRAPVIIMDRRAAIRHALSLAKKGDAVLVSGKGTDPYIMRANGTKEPWSDVQVLREELEKLIAQHVKH